MRQLTDVRRRFSVPLRRAATKIDSRLTVSPAKSLDWSPRKLEPVTWPSSRHTSIVVPYHLGSCAANSVPSWDAGPGYSRVPTAAARAPVLRSTVEWDTSQADDFHTRGGRWTII